MLVAIVFVVNLDKLRVSRNLSGFISSQKLLVINPVFIVWQVCSLLSTGKLLQICKINLKDFQSVFTVPIYESQLYYVLKILLIGKSVNA